MGISETGKVMTISADQEAREKGSMMMTGIQEVLDQEAKKDGVAGRIMRIAEMTDVILVLLSSFSFLGCFAIL